MHADGSATAVVGGAFGHRQRRAEAIVAMVVVRRHGRGAGVAEVELGRGGLVVQLICQRYLMQLEGAAGKRIRVLSEERLS